MGTAPAGLTALLFGGTWIKKGNAVEPGHLSGSLKDSSAECTGAAEAAAQAAPEANRLAAGLETALGIFWQRMWPLFALVPD